jgi:hypothetical protein
VSYDELRFRVEQDVCEEAERADKQYGPFLSTHEALGVLLEEFEELRVAIRSNLLPAMEREAIQVAAVALRLAEACRRDDPAFRERSGAA